MTMNQNALSQRKCLELVKKLGQENREVSGLLVNYSVSCSCDREDVPAFPGASADCLTPHGLPYTTHRG